MPEPRAEIELSVADVRRLLAAQHPRLLGELRHVAHGWDNDVFRLGDDLAVRLPRRALAAELAVSEQRWLPRIAPLLPVPTPVPVAVGVPDAHYPWPWSVVPWFEGRRAAEVSAAERDAIAEPLARTLAALHVPAPSAAPVNRFRGVPLAERADDLLAGIADDASLRRVVEAGLAAPPWRRAGVWVHGDAHPGNVVLTPERRIAALVDFGDLTAGDPACDLACAWLTFTERGRRRFRRVLEAAYDDATWTRARAWAAWFAHLLAGTHDPALREVGRHGLAQATGSGPRVA